MKKEQHKLCDGNVVVYTRPKVNTSYYHARVKLPEISKWKYFSTKTDDLEAAKEFALREYQKFQIKLENGYVLDTRRFRVVAEIAIKEMEQQLELGVGKVSYHDYIRKIGHFKEFFGNRYVNNITYEDLVDYDKQRTDRIGRKAAKSTINTHNAALARVFDVAVRNGWMHESQVLRTHALRKT